MFKRVFMLLLAALLLASTACAEPADALYLLVNNDTPMGSAVLYQDQTTLLTAAWVLLQGEGDVYAVGAGGTLPVTEIAVMEDSELLRLTLGEASPAAPLTMSTATGPAYVLGHGTDLQPRHEAVEYLSAFPYGEDSARLLFTAPAALLPGSVLLDEAGALCGVTLAAYGEGVNRYAALPAEDILLAAQEVSWLTDFTVTPGAGSLTVDWSECDVACDREDCVMGLFIADVMNPFYSYLTAEEGTSTTLPVVPGRSYEVWVQHAHQEISTSAAHPANAAVAADVAEALPFDLYDYQDTEIYLSSAPMEELESSYNTYIPPMEDITAQTLADPDKAIFLQVCSTYTVEENTEADLLVVLTTPEGYALDYLGQFLFDTTLQEKDMWNVEIYPLLDDYLAFNETGEFAPGEYAVSYYLDGALANRITWTLE